MKFRVKDMDIATGGIFVAILNQKDAHKLDLHSGDRILVADGQKSITCILDISESDRAVSDGKIGLFEEVLANLNVKHGAVVEVKFTGKPESVAHIRDKLFGKELRYREILHIMSDIAHDHLTDIEKTYFVAAGFVQGWTPEEIVHMTKAMVNTGKRLKFSPMTLDKHCIGGVGGNRTTMVVVPIIAAAGFTIPKTSSRAITSPAGTADTMECLAQVELSEQKIKEVVRKTGACIIHGGSLLLAPADDKIIDVEHPLSIDAEGQLLASVMAKKYSVSATHVLIDIPMGKGTKAPTKKKGRHLKKMFELIGKKMGMKVKVILTDGSQPIGNAVGPLLEAQDVMSVLRNDPHAPPDLRKKALYMAGQLLEMTKKYKKGQGEKVAQDLLDSGQAFRKMKDIIEAQGRQNNCTVGRFSHQVKAPRAGIITAIDNETIAKIARISGAPHDKGAGLLLVKKVGSSVQKNEKLFNIYAESEFKIKLVKEYLQQTNGYVISGKTK